MGRKLAYLAIATLGYIVGVLIYYLALNLVPLITSVYPYLSSLLLKNRQVIEVLVSGTIGSIFSVIIAYIWASKAPSL
ncbi:MAG: hypothetical protein QXH96_00350 [Candidatus Geothermarchaeota archaeon]